MWYLNRSRLSSCYHNPLYMYEFEINFLTKFTVGRFPSHELFSTLTINMVMAMFYYCVENQSINLLNINLPLIITNCFIDKKFKSLVVLFFMKI